MSEPIKIYKRLLTTDCQGRKAKTLLLKELIRRVKAKYERKS
jgi:hypothetical protein